jgi:hypothetical protein
MHRHLIRAGLTAFALVALVPAAYAQAMRAGLWEMQVETNGLTLPPDVIAKMQQNGVSVPAGPHTMSHQHCVTPEQAAKEFVPPATRPEDKCVPKNYQKSASSVNIDMTCDGTFKGTATLKGGVDSDSAYHGSMDMVGSVTLKNGVTRPLEMHNKFSGRWLAADCGSVAPLPSQK